MKRSSGQLLGLYTVGIAVLFLMGFMMLVVFGAEAYRDAAAGQADNNDARALLAYLSNCIKGSDSSGHISVQDSEEGLVLLVADGSGYALHIYQSDGWLLEEYSAENAPLNPAAANALGETELFAVEKPAENILRISTDAGNVLLYLRSGERSK